MNITRILLLCIALVFSKTGAFAQESLTIDCEYFHAGAETKRGVVVEISGLLLYSKDAPFVVKTVLKNKYEKVKLSLPQKSSEIVTEYIIGLFEDEGGLRFILPAFQKFSGLLKESGAEIPDVRTGVIPIVAAANLKTIFRIAPDGLVIGNRLLCVRDPKNSGRLSNALESDDEAIKEQIEDFHVTSELSLNVYFKGARKRKNRTRVIYVGRNESLGVLREKIVSKPDGDVSSGSDDIVNGIPQIRDQTIIALSVKENEQQKLTSIIPKIEIVELPLPEEVKPTLIESRKAPSVCDVFSNQPVYTRNTFSDQIQIAGVVKNNEPVSAYEIIANTSFQLNDINVVLDAEVGELIALTIPSNKPFKNDLGDAILLVGLPDVRGLVDPSIDANAEREQRLNILVVGDSRSVANSGLSKIDTSLSDAGFLSDMMIEWHDVSQNGSLLPAEKFSSFLSLISNDGIADEAKFLSTSDKFGRFLHDFATVIVESKGTFDLVVWVKEGYILPHSAPSQMEEFLLKANEYGKIARNPDGRPRKWLRVVSGAITQDFSREYIKGPLKTSNVLVGELIEESSGTDGSTREFIDSADRIRDYLINTIKLRSDKGKAKYDGHTLKNLVMDTSYSFSELGLVVPLNQATDFYDSLESFFFLARALEAKIIKPSNVGTKDIFDLFSFQNVSTNLKGQILNAKFNPELIEIKLRQDSSGLLDFIQNQSFETDRLTGLVSPDKAMCSHYYIGPDLFSFDWQNP